MDGSDKGISARGFGLFVGGALVLAALAVGLPVVVASFMTGAEMPIEERALHAREQMDSARRAYEAEGEPASAGETGGDTAMGDGTVTPAEVPPQIKARALDDGSGIVGVWLAIPSYAPKPVRFDQASDSMTVLFTGVGERRAVPMSGLFSGGAWEIRPGGMSAEHRTTAPAGFTGAVEFEFVHVSKTGGRTVVTERVTVY